ncbi:MAG: TolC family protein, partial [Campylobacterales bacterium]
DSGRTQALIKEREAQAKAAGLMYDYAKETTALKITELYLQLANLEEIAEVYRQKELFLEAQHTKMELFWKAGRIALDTLEKTRAALAEVRYRNAELAWQQLQVRNLLIQLTGERVEKITPVTFKNPVPSQTSNRADIAALQEELVAAKERTKQAKSADGPTVTLDDTLSYTQYPGFSPVKMSIGGKTVVFDQPELQNRLALNLQISLYDFGAIKAESEAARLNELAATAKLQDAKEKQDLERQTALKSLEAAAVKLTAAQHYLTAAQTSFEAARRRFEAQVSDHVAFLDALTQHYEAQALLVQARNALELEKARYYYTTGTPIKEMIQ